MKHTENNEIDILLRSLARREGARPVSSEDGSGMHLDADELNSYAEQALPAAARARYTSHLADCLSCRKSVSELTSASGANVSEHPASQKTSASLLQRFRALFSPGLLRYAMPALALFAFVAVGLIVIRQQAQPDFVAQNQRAVAPDATIATKQTDSPVAGQDTAAIEEKGSSESRASAGKGGDEQAKTGERNEPPREVTPTDTVAVASNTDGASTTVTSNTDTSNKDASAGKAAGVVSSPYASEPPAPPPPKSQSTSTEARTEVAARQKEEGDKRDEPAREQEGARAQPDVGQNQAVSKARKAAPADQRVRPGVTLSGGAGEKTNDDADTRTVSGRRFRRQGGVWIDTAYQSSTATITLARGSEQFRALVADEPGIRAIAAQLAGEVVVVWKGRAYRIR